MFSSGGHKSGYVGDAYHIKILVQSRLGAMKIILLALEKRRGRSSSAGSQSSLWKWGRLLKKIQICFPYGRNWSYPEKKSGRSIHVSGSRQHWRIWHSLLFLLTLAEMVNHKAVSKYGKYTEMSLGNNLLLSKVLHMQVKMELLSGWTTNDNFGKVCLILK